MLQRATASNGMTEEQQQIRDLARELAEGELRPHAEEWDRESHFPREIIAKLGELGFLGMLIPEEYDGLGLDTTSYLIALEEIARGDASVAVAMSVHNSLPTQGFWVEGEPEITKFLGMNAGLNVRDRARYDVVTLRCERCGLLRSYARPEDRCG